MRVDIDQTGRNHVATRVDRDPRVGCRKMGGGMSGLCHPIQGLKDTAMNKLPPRSSRIDLAGREYRDRFLLTMIRMEENLIRGL